MRFYSVNTKMEITIHGGIHFRTCQLNQNIFYISEKNVRGMLGIRDSLPNANLLFPLVTGKRQAENYAV